MDAKLEIHPITHSDFHHYIDDLAYLRMRVFREWPYLYDGDMDYERTYLRSYVDNERTFMVGAFYAGDIVGASTAMPLADHDEAFAAPLRSAGYDISQVFYLAESVLLLAFRGLGAGRQFFEQREAEAVRQGFHQAVFSAVIRNADAPEKPQDYVPLDAFWQRLGYGQLADIKGSFPWKDLGDKEETEKPMAFWMKSLA
ncbi:hypothetical protein [Ahrensia sp. 13_GOM-1096m]|uniref:hypothetical protein n=1 Tax=Ahrensia sp. 13_GOM-1096m TaxID=1380380 RepID=UPI000688F46E|nr:hypothetical protein [Ahrensia sp. 13_GOM-1096m]